MARGCGGRRPRSARSSAGMAAGSACSCATPARVARSRTVPTSVFLLCSSFKGLLAAFVLARADRGQDDLAARIRYGRADLLGHSPVTEAHVAAGSMTVRDLCAAIVTESDNGGANLLLRHVGGPAALTAFLRGIGDPATRLDRWEMALNFKQADHDTTTPRAITGTAQSLLLGHVLAPASRALLEHWMVTCRTGLTRLRAAFPPDWVTADKDRLERSRMQRLRPGPPAGCRTAGDGRLLQQPARHGRRRGGSDAARGGCRDRRLGSELRVSPPALDLQLADHQSADPQLGHARAADGRADPAPGCPRPSRRGRARPTPAPPPRRRPWPRRPWLKRPWPRRPWLRRPWLKRPRPWRPWRWCGGRPRRASPGAPPSLTARDAHVARDRGRACDRGR